MTSHLVFGGLVVSGGLVVRWGVRMQPVLSVGHINPGTR